MLTDQRLRSPFTHSLQVCCQNSTFARDDAVTDQNRKKDCTYCKTVQPSLIFSRSPTATFPTEHHVKPSPAAKIEAARANADKLAKGQKWDAGLILPGTLDMSAFEFSDDQTSVVFEDADMVRLLSSCDLKHRSSADYPNRWKPPSCCSVSTAPTPTAHIWPMAGRACKSTR